MASIQDLPPLHIPRLDYWSILGFTWPIETIRPSETLICEKVRDRFVEAQQNAMLTGRVAWEILEAAKVLSDQAISWRALLDYAYSYCDPRISRDNQETPVSSYSATKNFAHSELSKPTYLRCGPTNGPRLEHFCFDHKLSFTDLVSPSAPPSICIGRLSLGGHLVFAYLATAADQVLCVVSEYDEWGGLNTNSVNRSNDELPVCICAPYTRISMSDIKEYVRAYTNWVMDSSPPDSIDGATDTGSGSPADLDEHGTPLIYDSKTKFLWFSMQ